MPDVHAKTYSPSGSCKWLNCPGSVLLEARFPDSETEYTREGTLAHAIAETKLLKHFTPMSKKDYNARMRAHKKEPLYDKEMLGYTDTYLDTIKEIAMRFSSTPFVTAEKQVSFEQYAPGGFGTADCIVIGDNTMYVCDFKYGKGVKVEAEDNTQGMLYALGALEAYRMFYDIREVVIVIIQPRLDHVSEFRISATALTAWAKLDLTEAVNRIENGDAECIPGPWCNKGFCKARGVCRALADANIEPLRKYAGAAEDFAGITPPGELTPDEIGEVLTKAQLFKAWLTQLEEYALKLSLDGTPVKGWKVVAGRSVRQFTDTDKAFEHLIENGIDRDMLFERVPLTLTKVEKLVGKKKFEELAKDYVTRSEPKPTLVTEADKREEYKPNSAASDFAEI